MSKVFSTISMSLDGFVAGPHPSMQDPLGVGGQRLHEWAFRLRTFREPHGLEGGESDVSDELVSEQLARQGAVVMGRRMYSGGEGPWDNDPNARGWWGDDPPFHVPVFVLTHHSREPLEMDGGTTFHFVTDGVDSAIEQAKSAAGERDVAIGGGADALQQAVRGGLLDELEINLVPVLLGSGRRLLENLGDAKLTTDRVVAGSAVTHLRYRVG
jgi:dihydrofolate reductase